MVSAYNENKAENPLIGVIIKMRGNSFPINITMCLFHVN